MISGHLEACKSKNTKNNELAQSNEIERSHTASSHLIQSGRLDVVKPGTQRGTRLLVLSRLCSCISIKYFCSKINDLKINYIFFCLQREEDPYDVFFQRQLNRLDSEVQDTNLRPFEIKSREFPFYIEGTTIRYCNLNLSSRNAQRVWKSLHRNSKVFMCFRQNVFYGLMWSGDDPTWPRELFYESEQFLRFVYVSFGRTFSVVLHEYTMFYYVPLIWS